MTAGSAAQKLVDLMGIEQLTKDTIRTGTDSPQGVQESEPVDYFRRIAAEELSPSELRDQSVLRDIDQWKSTRSGPLLGRLLASSDADEEYARVWEHFSDRHTDAELMELVEQLVAKIKERDGSTAAADHRALIALWRRCNHRLHRNEHVDWLRALILDAIPVSLHLANGLFYYWTGEHGIANGAARSAIRQSIVQTVRAIVRTGDDLARVLTSEHPYSIGRLITQTGADPGVAAFEAWRDYLPALVIDGAEKHPEALVPELANLAGDEQSGIVAASGEYPWMRRWPCWPITPATMPTPSGQQMQQGRGSMNGAIAHRNGQNSRLPPMKPSHERRARQLEGVITQRTIPDATDVLEMVKARSDINGRKE